MVSDGMNEMNSIVDKISEILILYGFKLLGAIFIIILGGYCVKAVKRFLTKRLEKTRFDDSFNNFAVSTVAVLMWTFIILAILAKFGIEVAPLVAGLGVVGFAIGFAVQGSLSNFAAGVMMIILKPFKMGDLINVAGIVGIVQDVGIMTCTFATLDNKKVIIPNSKIFGETITNLTGFPTRRVDMSVGVAYNTDLEKASKALVKGLASCKLVLGEPAPMAEVVEFGDSSINFTVRAWCKTENYLDVFYQCNKNIKAALDEAGIEIPFPQRVVHMQKND